MDAGTAPYWNQVIADLEQDLGAAEAKAAALQGEAEPLALPATQGDGAAKRALDRLEDEQGKQARHLRNLRTALAQAQARRQAAAEAEAEAQRLENLEKARGIAREIERVDLDKIGAALVLLREGFAEREALAQRLAPLGALDGTLHRKLRNRVMLLAALHHAGLASFLQLDRVAGSFHMPLAQWDRTVLGNLLEPAQAEVAPDAPQTEAA